MPHMLAQAFNATRGVPLATDVFVAATHWSRLRGLIGTRSPDFGDGKGLWIRPCRGIHTLAMRFPIDVIYLDRAGKVIHLMHSVPPWRFSPIRMDAASVLELPAVTLDRTKTALGDCIEITMK